MAIAWDHNELVLSSPQKGDGRGLHDHTGILAVCTCFSAYRAAPRAYPTPHPSPHLDPPRQILCFLGNMSLSGGGDGGQGK